MAVGADPVADRHPRQLLLGQYRAARDARDRSSGPPKPAATSRWPIGTPFISGKDSLNNEYTHEGRSLAIPPTLLISAIGIVPDVRRCVTMDLKEAGNALYVLGMTRDELGGSLWAEVNGRPGGRVPRVDAPERARLIPGPPRGDAARTGPELPRSERGRAGGGPRRDGHGRRARRGGGARSGCPRDEDADEDFVLLFSESPTRFILEVGPEHCGELSRILSRLAARPARRRSGCALAVRRRHARGGRPSLGARGLGGRRSLGGRLRKPPGSDP